MKIGIFGNTNNAPLMIAQALRDLGHEVLLVVNSQQLLNRPESRYLEFRKGYPAWILDAAHLSEWDFISLSPPLAPVLDALATCDALILNDLGPSLWPLLRQPSIAFLTGSDLSHYGTFATVNTRTAGWSPDFRASPEGQMIENLLQEFIQRQREGIRQAVAVFHLPRGVVPESDAILDSLDVCDSGRVFQYLAELRLIKPAPAPHNDPLRIFSATRLTWKLPVEPGRSLLDYKGSDIMIRGLGLFHRKTNLRLHIRLIKKGLHLVETEQLLAEEGLSDQVTWLEEMSLTDVWLEFARSDIVIEQLGSSAIGMAGMDAMATGRPVIGNPRPELFRSYLDQSNPICQARTADDVCRQLTRLVYDSKERERLGALGRRFMEERCSPHRLTQEFLNRIEAVLVSDKTAIGRGGVGHAYYLQRIYEERESCQILEQSRQDANAKYQAAQTELTALKSSLLLRAVLKLTRLAEKIISRLGLSG